MELTSPQADRARWTVPALSAGALAALFLSGLLVTLAGTAQAAVPTVPLGTAGSFAVLAGAGVTNTGPTTLNGDLGSYPTTTITGTSSLTVTGTNHGGDAVTQDAKNALVTAYDNAAGRGPVTETVTQVGGRTLGKGVYTSASSMGLTGTLTLDGQNDPNSVFVFQAVSSLTTASASRVTLVNGAQACRVFWQVGSSATLGTGSVLRGTVLAMTSITATHGATISGRLLARNGAVTLDTNVVSRPGCVTGPSPTATPTPTASATPTATATATASATATATATRSSSGTSTARTRAAARSVAATRRAAAIRSAAAARRAAAARTAAAQRQVRHVPVGAVHAGDGSTSGEGPAYRPLAGWLAAAGALATVLLVTRRRRRNS